MIQVARDFEGLRVAALELMEEEFQGDDRDRLVRRAQDGATNREAMLAQSAPSRTLSDGYYLRANYLFWLRSLELPKASLNAAEESGLRAVAVAFSEFEKSHPGCPHCGMRNEKARITCKSCGKKTVRGANR